MQFDRRTALKGIGGTLALPLLESTSLASREVSKTRLLVVGNPFGAHPDHFFPSEFGTEFEFPKTISSLDWLRDRLTILGHTDHGMKSGHGREIAFLSGVLPETSHAFPEKNKSIDQYVARLTGNSVRYPSIHAGLERGIRLSWNANGVAIDPITDPQKLFDHLFLNLTADEKRARHELLDRNGSLLDAVGQQFATLRKRAGKSDRDRLDQFSTSLRTLERNLSDRKTWIGKDKPKFDISNHFAESGVTIRNKYSAIFDMVAYAFETDLTRVATVSFSPELSYLDINGVTRSYHGCTHNGRKEDTVSELVAIESFQVEQLARCLKRLDSIPEPNSDGTMLDHTVVLFGSGMGYGGTHSNRNLPIFVAGGGFKHRGFVDCRDAGGQNMPLCNLFVTLLQRFGIEEDEFNVSTGAFDLSYA